MLAAMKVGHGKDGKPESSMPVTGGRFLYTGEGCPRQALHTDFEVNKRRDPHKVPGYFAVCTGQYEAQLSVVPYSYRYLRYSSGAIGVLSNAVKAKKIWIPPYSVFFGSRD